MECFEELSFPDWAVKQLRDEGYIQPLPIQVQCWPIALGGHDMVGIADTGSGKTVAYVLPMLVHIIAQKELQPGEGPVGLVIVPTRDLCQQVARTVRQFTNIWGLECQSIFGGTSQAEQEECLRKRSDIIVATPGRFIDMLNRGKTNLLRATFIVLDEADELLDQDFGDQIRLLLSHVRPDRQVLLFSATWPEKVE